MAVQSGSAKKTDKKKTRSTGELHHLAYNFYVEINGHAFSFMKVSGLENSISFEEIHEGGCNGYSYRMRNYDTGQHILTLEYGASKSSLELDRIEPGRYLTGGVYVAPLNHASAMSGRSFQLEGCYVQRITFGEFHADQSAVLINRMEIAYSKLHMSANN